MLKSYESYTSIKLPWLEKIPSHWLIQRAKTIFFVFDKRSETGTEELLSVSQNYGVVHRKNINVTMFKAESYVGYKLCYPNDLAVNSLWAWQYGLGISKYKGIISTAYSVYRFRDLKKYNTKFYDYYTRSTAYHWEMRVRSKGLWKSRYQLSDSSFMDSPMLIPPREEQDQIVRYLDWQLAKITKLIRAKKKQIALLNEQKDTVINKATTQGINSTVAFKSTGLNWCPNIPAHWRVVPAKALFSERKATKYFTDEPLTASQKYGIITQEEFMNLENRRIVLANQQLEAWKHVEPNDFIISLRSFQGGLELSAVSGCITWHYIVLMPNDKVLPAYYKWLFKSQSYIKALQRTSDFIRDGQDLRFSNFVKVKLFEIPLDEQYAISEYINDETSKVNAAIKKINQEIEFISEYRTRLISDVVTGKVDVRDIEIPEFEPLSEADIDDEAGEESVRDDESDATEVE